MLSKVQLMVDTQIKDSINDIKVKRGLTTTKAFFDNAIALMLWALEESDKGRSIVSIDKEEKKIKEIILPIFSVKAKKVNGKNGGTD